jgi:hypothetical protein
MAGYCILAKQEQAAAARLVAKQKLAPPAVECWIVVEAQASSGPSPRSKRSSARTAAVRRMQSREPAGPSLLPDAWSGSTVVDVDVTALVLAAPGLPASVSRSVRLARLASGAGCACGEWEVFRREVRGPCFHLSEGP